MKRIYGFLVLLVGLALTGCQLSDLHNLQETDPAPEGYVNISFGAQILGQPKVMTKVVDPDGEDINTMTLFCFDSYGLFISTATATLTPDSGTPSLSGSFKATIPNHTGIIHFVANQNMAKFSAQPGMSEDEVLSVLEGSSGMMIYWGRHEKSDPASGNIADELKGKTINLVRNHAKITVANPTTNGYLVVTGFAVVNSNAFGTVAPYHPEKGFFWTNDYTQMDFVTLPHNKAKLSDIHDVRHQESQYIFESENTSDDPISVIIAGYEPGDAGKTVKYYRVVLVDENVEQVLVVRNFEYILNITGTLSYGQSTFESALAAPATNNVWLSIADNINEVRSDSYILAVEETDIIIRADKETFDNQTYEVFYTYTDINGDPVAAAQAPSVTWLDGNNVAYHNFTNSYDAATGVGTIYLTLNHMDELDMRSGTLLVKSGPLQRKINVITIKAQDFTPAWITTQVYGLKTGEHITLVFNVPETTPDAVFPMEVLISTNILDVRSESGMDLPIRYSTDDDFYGSTDESINPWGYKYVMTVTEPGKQRVYFHNILEQDGNVASHISLESPFFNTLTRQFTFSDQNKAIMVEGLREYDAHNHMADDEVIYYMLVPQKRGAQVVFDSHLVDLDYAPTNPNYYLYPAVTDEFMFYTNNLDHSHVSHAAQFEFRAAFNTEQGGRILGFTPLSGVGGAAGATFHLETNKAKSAEIVRLASNAVGMTSILDASKTYAGNTYRSFVFELANYHPYHFAAKVNGQGDYTVGENPETVSDVTFTYQPGQEVNVEFDVTSFRAPSDASSVDPFGEQFEIYIDAPMLELDAARLAACNLTAAKIKADPSTPGRFIYTVDADRAAEKAFGTGAALAADATGADQSGERKTIPFKTKDIVSAGKITISSNEEKVVFYSKTFDVANSSITGTIKYNDGTLKDVPAQSFVPFELVSDNTRIGAITLSSDGNYQLRLRAEYEFEWETDKVQFEVEIDGKVYYAEYASLKDLFANPNVTMTLRL